MKSYWIKERSNPQFKEPYYVGYGQLSQKEAKEHEGTLYGYNIMLRFMTKNEYEAKLAELKALGKDVVER